MLQEAMEKTKYSSDFLKISQHAKCGAKNSGHFSCRECKVEGGIVITKVVNPF